MVGALGNASWTDQRPGDTLKAFLLLHVKLPVGIITHVALKVGGADKCSSIVQWGLTQNAGGIPGIALLEGVPHALMLSISGGAMTLS